MTIQIHPLNKDIIIRRIDDPAESQSNILLLGKREKEYNVAWFEAVAVGSLVTEVVVGSKILINYGDQIQPFICNGEVFTLTDESKVLAIILKGKQ